MKEFPYYEGYFWVINNKLECMKMPCDYEGNYDRKVVCQDGITPAFYWEKHYRLKYDVSYDYYPKGKIIIKNGLVYIYIPNEKTISYQDFISLNNRALIDVLQDEYNISELPHIIQILKGENND